MQGVDPLAEIIRARDPSCTAEELTAKTLEWRQTHKDGITTLTIVAEELLSKCDTVLGAKGAMRQLLTWSLMGNEEDPIRRFLVSAPELLVWLTGLLGADSFDKGALEAFLQYLINIGKHQQA